MHNRLSYSVEQKQNEIFIKLSPQESCLYIVTEEKLEAEKHSTLKKESQIDIEGTWEVSFSTAQKYPDFESEIKIEQLENIAKPSLYPNFSGTIRYEISFNFLEKKESNYFLDLGDVYEIAEVFVNENKVGIKIAKPYKFEVTDYLKEGLNTLTIDVTNTLGTMQKDYLSQYRVLQPSGLLGKVTLQGYSLNRNG